MRLQILYVASTIASFPAMLCGLLSLAIYPIAGVLSTLGGMALLLYGAAGLCGAGFKDE